MHFKSFSPRQKVLSFTVLFFQFDSWLETKNVAPIGVFLFLMIAGYVGNTVFQIRSRLYILIIFRAAIQDCSTDGWILSKLHPSNIQLAGPIQSCGIKIGLLFGFAVFAELERAFPDVITIQRWFIIIASGLLLLCFVLYFCIAETRVDDQEDKNETEEMTLEDKMGSWTVLKNVVRNHFNLFE